MDGERGGGGVQYLCIDDSETIEETGGARGRGFNRCCSGEKPGSLGETRQS